MTAIDTPPWHLRGNWAPVQDELTETRLRVEGAIPPELDGLYVRTGPNPKTGSSPPGTSPPPPVATVHLPQRVPYGAHGSWIPASALA